MAKCNRCDGGSYMLDGEENTCYHCEGTGRISEATAQADQRYALVEQLAAEQVSEQRRARNNNPDGEDWAFCAAENMMSEYDYTQSRIMDQVHVLLEKIGGGFNSVLDRVPEGATFNSVNELKRLLNCPVDDCDRPHCKGCGCHMLGSAFYCEGCIDGLKPSIVDDPKTPTDEDPRADEDNQPF
jgi:hypothetical protein